MSRIIEEKDIHVYKTLSGEYRAYVRGEANLEAHGQSKKKAILNLGRVLDKETDYGFDLTFAEEM